jgi:hypothetical protein
MMYSGPKFSIHTGSVRYRTEKSYGAHWNRKLNFKNIGEYLVVRKYPRKHKRLFEMHKIGFICQIWAFSALLDPDQHSQ